MWYGRDSIPLSPGVKEVIPPFTRCPDKAAKREPRYARWTGEYWTCWGVSPEAVATVEFRGPSAGYMWREISVG